MFRWGVPCMIISSCKRAIKDFWIHSGLNSDPICIYHISGDSVFMNFNYCLASSCRLNGVGHCSTNLSFSIDLTYVVIEVSEWLEHLSPSQLDWSGHILDVRAGIYNSCWEARVDKSYLKGLCKSRFRGFRRNILQSTGDGDGPDSNIGLGPRPPFKLTKRSR